MLGHIFFIPYHLCFTPTLYVFDIKVNGRSVPGRSVPGRSVPEISVPGRSAPQKFGDGSSGRSVPGRSVPENHSIFRPRTLCPRGPHVRGQRVQRREKIGPEQHPKN